jgi:hypoxanthine phosphoribosyltransferase
MGCGDQWARTGCPPEVERILLTAEQIQGRVAELAGQLQRDYQGKYPLLVGVLLGAVVFLADLMRHLRMPLSIDFVQLASYGTGTTSSGTVQVVKDLSQPVAGREVIVVEDIVDTGRSLCFLLAELARRGARSVASCVLLDKPSRREVPVQIDYRGFEIPDCFVVGYGLDFAHNYRHLPFVAQLRPEAYREPARQESERP